MNKFFKKNLLALVLVFVLSVTGFLASAYENCIEIAVEPKFGQTEAREMLSMINSFRTGSEAWYWNEDNKTKTTLSSLSNLTYDYDLEKIAMKRAAEIAVYYSHTRPDGSSCFDAYTSAFLYGSCGENIAAGYPTGESVFVAWREDDDDYSGQGHRRNMLSKSFKSVGIGHVYYGGLHYWVQEFSSNVVNTAETSAVDSTRQYTIDLDTDFIQKMTVNTSVQSLTLEPGTVQPIPAVKANISTVTGWNNFSADVSGFVCTSSDKNVVTVEGINLKAVGTGSAVLSIEFYGKTMKVNVEVAHSPDNGTVTKQPTCGAQGEKSFICSVCKTTIRTETIPATGKHKYTETITKEPLCFEPGEKKLTCSQCGDTKTETIDAIGYHEGDEAYSDNRDGTHSFECVLCGEKSTEQHSLISRCDAATFEKDGYYYKLCEECGYTSEKNTIYKVNSVTVSPTVVYTGKTLTPKVTVKDSQGKVLKANGEDYFAEFSNNKKIGTASVKIILTGDYEGEKTVKFKIVSPQVTGLKQTKAGTDSVTVTWTKVTGAKSYKVQYSADGKKWTTKNTTSNSVTVSKLSAGKTYSFKVTAVAGNNLTGKASAVFKVSTLTASPKLSSLKSSKSKTATVSWGKVTGASKYIVYKSTDGKKWTKVTTTTKTSYTLTKLTGGKRVYVKVVAVNANGKNSSPSPYKYATVKK